MKLENILTLRETQHQAGLISQSRMTFHTEHTAILPASLRCRIDSRQRNSVVSTFGRSGSFSQDVQSWNLDYDVQICRLRNAFGFTEKLLKSDTNNVAKWYLTLKPFGALNQKSCLHWSCWILQYLLSVRKGWMALRPLKYARQSFIMKINIYFPSQEVRLLTDKTNLIICTQIFSLICDFKVTNLCLQLSFVTKRKAEQLLRTLLVYI